ncbi:ATP-binding cassette domain-containing protein [Otariodibacter sp.]|uniref:ATP-binding cassette domain-containing protein n=1 Tax=Otariodibacter sp. TaxID=3030919 RepID=UPI00261119EE|nr:ATP-binding cassette domain-containing protein [Otariodibacter sp.]
MSNIEFKNVTKIYGKKVALDNVSMSLPNQKISCIMGLSGSGKSTLLRHINRLLDPTSGEVWVNGQNLIKLRAKELQKFRQDCVSMIFQHFGLLPHLNVIENIEYGLKVKGIEAKERREKALYWLNEVGLVENVSSYPQDLSGGMKQRIGIARAFACDTPILLMDEPFSALDPITRAGLQNLVLELQHKWPKTIVFVTHDLDEAEKVSDHVILLEQGRVEQIGSFDALLKTPATEHVITFMQIKQT